MEAFWRAFDAFKERLGEWVRPILTPLFDVLELPFEVLPLEAGRWCALGLFIICTLWVLTLKADYIYQGALDRAKWRDLRVWTVLFMIPYVYIYYIF